ncbi:hypothetical protein [Bacillus sp. V5-8f]|uniref:hypothetical protein n=1 Tax=Bacillus sp. V5-8f TaxID=2053044 RepID=UPI000C782027|nr:hypothetical protein [Bacillus sp. V5-8f]PLT32124.1 hypothetical protein CUU64_21425 [Bacillus sp. V5-8f]
MGYVKLDPKFVQGLNDWIDAKNLKRTEIVEVFAGDGKLGKALRLPKENITDDHSWTGATQSTNQNWIQSAKANVYEKPEDATGTIKRFSLKKKQISLLVMGFPPDDTSAYEAAKELNSYFPNAQILYIGTGGFTPRFPIASYSFFDHTEDVDDSSICLKGKRENFDSLVRENYNQIINDEIIATLKKFTYCDDDEEECIAVHEGSKWCKQ